MQKEVTVEIDGTNFQGILSEDGKTISILNVVDEDDVDFIGRFFLDGLKLIEFYPMTNRRIVIGDIVNL